VWRLLLGLVYILAYPLISPYIPTDFMYSDEFQVNHCLFYCYLAILLSACSKDCSVAIGAESYVKCVC